MDFRNLAQRAMHVRQQYADLEKKQHGRAWTNEEVALGFAGDVGDLMKLVQAKNGVRDIPDADSKLAHELADCLWSVIVLSELFGVDLESAFMRAMDDVEAAIAAQKPVGE